MPLDQKQKGGLMQLPLTAVLLASLVAIATTAPVQASPCETYSATLSAMVTADQALRKRMDPSAPRVAGKLTRVEEQLMLVDRENTRRLKTLIEQCGWPKRSVQGDKSVHDAWLLTQHADQDRAFQKRVIVLLEKAVSEGEAPPRALAYLDDRIATAEKKPQRYGTQFIQTSQPCNLEFLPMDDPVKVDERRKAIGLPTLAQYLDEAKRMFCRAAAAN